MTGLVLILEFPNEMESWRFAAALEAREAGDKDRATKLLEELLEKSPDDSRFLAAKYRWNKEDGNYAAALDYLQQQISGEQEGTVRYAALLMLRSQIYLHLQRYPEAIADCLDLARFHKTTGKPSREEVLNGLAYARALGGTELDAALIDINAAIGMHRAGLLEAEQELQKAVAAKKSIFTAQEELTDERASLLGCLDTRGLVQFKQENYEAAQVDFDEAVQLLRQVREFYRMHAKTYSVRHRKYETYLKQKQMFDHNDAVIYYHRSLNLRKLGRDAEADRDWEQARELIGKEPDETLF